MFSVRQSATGIARKARLICFRPCPISYFLITACSSMRAAPLLYMYFLLHAYNMLAVMFCEFCFIMFKFRLILYSGFAMANFLLTS